MTSCNIDPRILRYMEQVEADEPRACPEQHALVKLVRRCFATEDIYTDTEQLDRYLGLTRYFPYEQLFPWEVFLLALWDCTYWRQTGAPRWDTAFAMLGRGAGKDGFIAFDGACSVSPYNPVPHYNVDICANNQEQAVRPQQDLIDVLEAPAHEAKLKRHFYHTKEVVQGRKNRGVMKGHTNNPKGRDGLRPGKIIFNEVHSYENYDNINVFVTALGKTGQPRTGFFTSNGDVSDGPLDDYLARGRRILFEDEPDEGFLPFICCLPEKDMVHDPQNWPMANPSLPWLPNLQKRIGDEYRDWVEHPEQNGSFLTKRFGLRSTVNDMAVTDYPKIQATNRPLPEMNGQSCTVGVDYAELSDWAAVNLHFRRGEERFDINHAWVCAQSKTLPRVKAPWRAWAEAGHITVVDDVAIPADTVAAYILQAAMRYDVRGLALDHFRWQLLAEALRKIGFDPTDRKNVKLVRPSDIMQVVPVIGNCFDRQLFTWGDVPHLRWATQNTKLVRSGKKAGSDTGNFYYAKIEAKSRKTDPFMALAASMVIENLLPEQGDVEIPDVDTFIF